MAASISEHVFCSMLCGRGSGPRVRALSDRVVSPRPARTAPRVGLGPLLLVLMVALAVMITGVWTLYQRAQHAERVAAARTAAVEAARSHAEELLSYDYRTFEDDLAEVEADTTGTFRTDYLRTVQELVVPQAKKYEVVVRARVVAASVMNAEPERAVTLLFVNQATQSNRLEGTQIDQNRVRMTLEKVDGRWLVSDLAAL